LLGIDNPQAFYCSELVWWASGGEARFDADETVILPSDLMRYGEVIYWSGNRTDAQLVRSAALRVGVTGDGTRLASAAQRQ
jgi:hypothetical protein